MNANRDKTSPDQRPYSRYTFQGHTGYIVAPWIPGIPHELVTIRHSASVPPWTDHDVHLHTASEEYYFLFQGELRLLIAGSALTITAGEVLMVKPHVPHAVVGGSGPIEHFVIRMPAPDDRQTVGPVPAALPPVDQDAQRELRSEWGCRAPLTEAQFQNCWLFGVGQARFHSEQMCLAYLNFPTAANTEANQHTHPHCLHLHRQSWEYYTVLRGTKVLWIEDQLVEIDAGEVLAVPPQVKHVLQATRTPFEGFTFRVPRLNDKVEFPQRQ